jgi:hypothetical protein
VIQPTKDSIPYTYEQHKSAKFLPSQLGLKVHFALCGPDSLYLRKGYIMVSKLGRFYAKLGREKITKPNPFLRSWHPVAILMVIPCVQLLFSSVNL